MGFYHNPILLHQAIDGLNIREHGVYVDMTYGGGGYSAEILRRAKDIKVIAFDMDSDALVNKLDDNRLTLVHSNFCFFDHFLDYLNIQQVDGIVADLGVSSHQFDTAERGFSFRFDDGPLDLRMNKEAHKTAAQVLNTYSEEKLKEIFYRYGEVENAAKLSKQIVIQRNEKKLEKVSDFLAAINLLIPKGKEHKYLAKVFQALRIEVNEELDALKEMLEKSVEYLKPEGRLSIVSYHSLEDGLVKNFIKSGNFEGKIEKDFKGNQLNVKLVQVHKKAIQPTEQEIESNNRARSAKLRIAERI
ncbi:MAG TPA: 16S rRNA (cytosine(1402)-N(4))-methyltransferase RsmH [Bacteroidales bacterium]|nr:16S rRNA (cytosine(1402)-N(4))-methyltransferase RsmH [Bacteroidales bacterium]